MTATVTRHPSARPDSISAEEWQVRLDLAACYRLIHMFGMDDLIYTHISAAVPGPEEHFLINPFGLLYEEVTASNLVKVDIEGNIISDSDYGINPAGYVIHSCIHRENHEIGCVLHTHTVAGVGVSAQKDGLLPVSQTAMLFTDNVAYHDYEGIALREEEQARMLADMGDKKVMILRNHGLLTAGESISETFSLLAYLEKSCQLQIDAISGGRELQLPDPEVCEHTAQQFDKFSPIGNRDWPGLLRKLDRIDPSFRD